MRPTATAERARRKKGEFMIETSRSKREGRPTQAESPVGQGRGTLLVVEDELAVARCYRRVLSALGYEVLTAGDGEAGRALFQREKVDAVISDLSMPGADGFELLAGIREVDPDMPVIIATGESEERVASRAIEQGALLVLTKPIDVRALAQVVEHAIRVRRRAPAAPREPPRAAIERALAGLCVTYEPVVHAPRGVVVGYKAIVGTNEAAFSGTRALFAAAEQVGCAALVGRAIRARIAADLTGAPRGAKIFVNLPAAALADDALYGPAEPLRAFAEQVVLEISERETLERLDRLAGRADDLRAAGFRLCVDGFGSGYAVLSAFVQLRPSVVKLDTALVRDLDTIAAKRRIAGSMASMCRQMGVDLIAEGVDTDAECGALLELGCDLQQGLAHGRADHSFSTVRPRTQTLKRTEALTVRPRRCRGALNEAPRFSRES